MKSHKAEVECWRRALREEREEKMENSIEPKHTTKSLQRKMLTQNLVSDE